MRLARVRFVPFAGEAFGFGELLLPNAASAEIDEQNTAGAHHFFLTRSLKRAGATGTRLSEMRYVPVLCQFSQFRCVQRGRKSPRLNRPPASGRLNTSPFVVVVGEG